MRDILFKAKKKYDGEWVTGSFSHALYTDNKKGILQEGYFIIEENGLANKVDPETVCEYTGKSDKNDLHKIFEWDIAKLPAWLVGIGKEEIAICKYIDSSNEVNPVIGFAFFDLDGKLVNSDEWDEFEVIGNVFDNPELIGDQP